MTYFDQGPKEVPSVALHNVNNGLIYSFPIQIVQDWNSLPGSFVEAGSLDHFKTALKQFLNLH